MSNLFICLFSACACSLEKCLFESSACFFDLGYLASGSITSCHVEGEKVEAVTFYFLGFKITADGDCSREIKRHLLLGRKAMTNSILKSRNITLLTKVHLVKAMDFPVVVYGWM